jgi:segregation and condensation protein B
MDNLVPTLHALLFAEGGALSYASLSKATGRSESDVVFALKTLDEALEKTGVRVIRTDTEAVLAVAPAERELVAKKIAAEYDRDIGDAGLEVLAILLYEGPSTRASVDYIRGVNSSSTIRTLLMRGLVERYGNPLDGREYVYRATAELLAHLGITDRKELPDYATIASELAAYTAELDHANRPSTGS